MRAHHATAFLAALFVLALGTSARAQPIDITLTEIPAPFTRIAETRFGRDFDFDGNRLVVASDDRVDTFLWDGAEATHEGTPMPTSGVSTGFGDTIVRLDGERVAVVAGEAYDFTQPAVYVLDLSGGSWVQTARLIDPAGSGDPVITDLAFDGPRLLVGCGYSRGNRGIGAVVHEGAGGVFSWTALNDVRVVGAIGDLNAFQLALDGDLVALSSIEAPGGGGRAGRVQLFRDTGTALTLLATMENPTPADRDQFGVRVGLAGGFVYVGARYDDTVGTDVGALYIYDTAGVLRQTILGPVTPPRAMFGADVHIDGDWMAVGTPAIFGGGVGVVLFYQRDATGTWQYRGRVADPDGRAASGFGGRVALDGRTFVVSSQSSPVAGAVNAGRAWVGVITEPDGGLCAADAECTNGNCVDGICCDTACAGACDVCGTGTCVTMTCDAGVLSDAGTTDDASTTGDASTTEDASTIEDASATDDSGVDAARVDGGVPSDSSVVVDASAADAGSTPRVPLSCTCRASAPVSSRGALVLVSLIALVVRARRRRR